MRFRHRRRRRGGRVRAMRHHLRKARHHARRARRLRVGYRM